MPYIYSVFREQAHDGYPILRPLILHEQELASNMYREEEFSFGDKILVSPVLKANVQSKVVYLPGGEWFDYWNNGRLKGGTEHEVLTPLDSMPIFVKAGSVIPEYPVMQFVNEKQIDRLKLMVYYSTDEEISYLYEDHGDTFAYEQQVYLEKKFTVKGSQSDFHIAQKVEGLFTEVYMDYEIHIIGLPFELKEIRSEERRVGK